MTFEQAMQLAPSVSMVQGVPLMSKIGSSNAKNLCTISKMTKNMSVMQRVKNKNVQAENVPLTNIEA